MLYADLGAERVLAAERGPEKITVEVKTFLALSAMTDLEQAIGQYILYEDTLAQTDPQRRVVLAIPQLAWDTIFVRDIGKLALQKRLRFVLVFQPESEVITQWVP